MRIVHFLWRMALEDGGVVRAILDLCPGLSDRGHEVTLLCSDPKDVPGEWSRAGAGGPRLARIDMPGRFVRYDSTALAQAERVIREADCIHLHGMWMVCNGQIAGLARRLGKAYVWSPHGMLDDWSMQQRPVRKRLFLSLRERGLLERAAFVHCTAEAELEQAGKHFPRGRGRVVPLLFDLTAFDPLPGVHEAASKFGIDRGLGPVVLFMSRLHPKKGVEALIGAVGELNETGTPCQLLIAGTGDAAYEAHIQTLCRSRLGDRGRCLGFVSGRTKVSLYQACDVFCLPSSQENFGYVVVEAMAAGVPVLTTKGVALWPQLVREDVAELCETDAASVGAGLKRLLGSPERMRDLGVRGRAWCLREFSSERIITSFEDMYAQAAGLETGARAN